MVFGARSPVRDRDVWEVIMDDDVRTVVIDLLEASFEAQLRAVRRLRQSSPVAGSARKSLSQIDMAYDVLQRAGSPLHVSVILERIRSTFGVTLDRESLVSSMTKKVTRGDRFTRTGKNTFALLETR